MKNTLALFGMVLASALTLPVAQATANVVYALHETESGNPGFEGTLTLADFISTATTFPVTDFSVSNNPAGFNNVEFQPDSSAGICGDQFGLTSCDLITLFVTSSASTSFGYPVDPFSTTGQNTVTNLASGFSMTLTVSQTSAVPEPSTWAMMALGFAGLGLAGWRSRRRSISIA